LNPVDEVFFKTKFDGVRRNLVTTGRLAPQKNHKMLIKAFAKIADKINDDLYIYGEGELRAELEQLVLDLNMQNRIFLPGAVKNVADTIKSAKLFILSSDFEGLPNSLMEAMALGIPCISTDCPCGGPKMLLNESYLCKTNCDATLCDLILKVIDKKICPNNYRVDPCSFQVHFVVNEWIKVVV
jgi:glycosyltransferase involved in cell wall biosynthesis